MPIFESKTEQTRETDGQEAAQAPVQKRSSNASIAAAAARARSKGVQAKGDLGGDDVHAVAASGVSGSGSALPHAEKIQASFGSHDISGVTAHSGSEAASATASLGAQAYATGSQIAFASATPDLHTAAHEAAHVIQQQGGVQLKGGLGEAGDSYEQHADAVADKVVAGESAQGLLDSVSGGASVQASGGSIQRLGEPRVGTAPAGVAASHVVVSGDTLGRIALQHGVSIEAMIAVNPHISSPDLIYPGDVLYVPTRTAGGTETPTPAARPTETTTAAAPTTAPEAATAPAATTTPTPAAAPITSGRSGTPPAVDHAIHTVASGDTLGAIARSRGVPLAYLITANPHIPNPSAISPGDVIYVPLEALPAVVDGTTGLEETPDHASGPEWAREPEAERVPRIDPESGKLTKGVSGVAMKRLNWAREAIAHTKEVFEFGAGNQVEALRATQMNSYYRMQVARNMSYWEIAPSVNDLAMSNRAALRAAMAKIAQGGNCGEHALMAFEYLRAKAIGEKIQRGSVEGLDHAFVFLGDVSSEKDSDLCISDPWPTAPTATLWEDHFAHTTDKSKINNSGSMTADGSNVIDVIAAGLKLTPAGLAAIQQKDSKEKTEETIDEHAGGWIWQHPGAAGEDTDYHYHEKEE